MASVRELIQRFAQYGFYPPEDFAAELRGLGNKTLHSPEALRTLAEFADAETTIQAILLEAPPSSVVEGLAPFFTGSPPERTTGLSLARLRWEQCLLSAPDAATTLVGPARALAERVLKDGGSGLPPAPWTSPFPAKTQKRAKVLPPPLPAWEERVHVPDNAPDLHIPDHAERDASVGAQCDNFPSLYWIAQMGDSVARARIQTFKLPQWVWEEPENVELMLWRFREEGLRLAFEYVDRSPKLVTALRTVESLRAAPLMAKALAGKPDTLFVAREWFARFPELGVVGLVPHVLGKDAEKAVRAMAYLRRHHADAFVAGLKRYDDDIGFAVIDAIERAGQLPAKPPKVPEDVSVDALPRPLSRDGKSALQGAALAELLAVLKATPLEGGPWLDDVRAAFTEASLGRLALALFGLWSSRGSPPKERWMLQACAHFPDDGNATLLKDLAASWAPRGLSARAQSLTEVLGAMGTRAGLRAVHELARKVRSKAFRAKAEVVFMSAAERHGLSEDELAERLIPTFELSPDGVFASTKLRFAAEGAKAKLVDEAGQPVKTLPALPDEELQSTLAELKKKGPGLFKEACERLERRMVESRRMSMEHFVEVYLMNGLLRRATEQLIWAVYDGAKPKQCFRMTASGPVTADGAPLQLPADATVGVVHPLELTDAQIAAFAGAWKTQPFAQVKRLEARVPSAEALRALAEAYLGQEVGAAGVLKLEKLGWQRGQVLDGGCYVEVTRKLPAARMKVEFEPGVYAGDPMMVPGQVVARVRVELGAEVSGVALNELARELRTALGDPPTTTPGA